MTTKVQTAADVIIQHYQNKGNNLADSCSLAAKGICNPKTLYHISRGQKTSKKIEIAILKSHKIITNGIDTRPGAMRLAYPDKKNAHKERRYIMDNLTPLERYYACIKAIEEQP